MVILVNFTKIKTIFSHSAKLINIDAIDMVEPVGSSKAVPLRSRKAILWGRVDVLAQAVEQFMEASMTWDVVRFPIDAGVENLVRETKRINPDVVILCQERMSDDRSLPIRLIQEQLCLRVVTVELESNLMQVYSKQNVFVQGASDFLSILDSGPFSDCTLGKEV